MSTDMRFDIRTQRYRLLRGELSHDDIDSYLDSLPDEAEEAEETETRFAALYTPPEERGEGEEE